MEKFCLKRKRIAGTVSFQASRGFGPPTVALKREVSLQTQPAIDDRIQVQIVWSQNVLSFLHILMANGQTNLEDLVFLGTLFEFLVPLLQRLNLVAFSGRDRDPGEFQVQGDKTAIGQSGQDFR